MREEFISKIQYLIGEYGYKFLCSTDQRYSSPLFQKILELKILLDYLLNTDEEALYTRNGIYPFVTRPYKESTSEYYSNIAQQAAIDAIEAAESIEGNVLGTLLTGYADGPNQYLNNTNSILEAFGILQTQIKSIVISGGGGVSSVSIVSANGFSGTVANATTAPAITLSTTVTGLLKGNGTAISSAIANTDYQLPISLTTTGSSGSATFSSNTLNIPAYTLTGLGGVPTSRTITINGVALDLSANRSYSVGTVTSISGGTGITGGTITSSGTLAFDTTWGDARYALASALSTYVPTTRTITINGTSFDLTANRTFNVGTITGVSVNSSNGFSGLVTNTSNNLAITLSTTITGLLKGNGTAISAAQANIDFLAVNNPDYTGTLYRGDLTFNPSNPLVALQSSVNTFNQLLIQNSSTGTSASSDVVVNNNLSNDLEYYGDFGINSSTYSGTGSLSLPNAVYLYSNSGDLVLGTQTANEIHLVTNNSNTDSVLIKTTGQLALPHYVNTTSFTGTPVGLLAFTSTGDIITVSSAGAGTVTSVDISVPTGLQVTNNPITTAGTIAISYTSGYAIPTTVSQTNWNTAYTEYNNATSANVINTLVKRDASGNFSASKITSVSQETQFIDLVPKPYNQKPAYVRGRMYYSSEASSIIMYSDSEDVELTLGERNWARCRNITGAPIPKGAPVYIASGVHIPGNPIHGKHMNIAMADASNINKINVIGIAAETIADGEHGYVITKGYITGVNTSGLTEGERVHLGASAGSLVSTSPEFPNFPVDLGICLVQSNISARNISNITLGATIVITTATAHGLSSFIQVTLNSISGTTQLNGNTYYISVINDTQFSLFSDANLTTPVNGTGFTAYISGGTTTPTAHYGVIYIDIQSHTFERLRINGSSYVDGNLTVAGDFTVLGSGGSVSVATLEVGNDWVYLGAGDTVTDTFSGTGLNDLSFKGYYTGTINRTFYVKITSVGAVDQFSWSFDNFATTQGANIPITGLEQTLAFGISVKFEALTGHTLNDQWSGLGVVKNVDFGVYGNYTVTENTHAGFFRDATDGVFKFFSSYTPEIETTINTSDPSFTLATVQANTFIGNLNGNAATVTDGVYTNQTYNNPTWIASLDWSKITNAPSIGGSGYTVITVSTTHNETVTSGTKIIKANTTSGSFTITLPSAVGNTATIIIKKVAGSPDLVIDGNGTETIDGGSTATLKVINESITLISDNTNWLIV
jgi:hypothetical protein